MFKRLKQKLGEPVAILCMRYWYRGFVVDVDAEDNSAVLSHAYAIEQTGPASAETAMSEDRIPNDICVNISVIEIVTQPAWVGNGYSPELIKEMKEKYSSKE